MYILSRKAVYGNWKWKYKENPDYHIKFKLLIFRPIYFKNTFFKLLFTQYEFILFTHISATFLINKNLQHVEFLNSSKICLFFVIDVLSCLQFS